MTNASRRSGRPCRICRILHGCFHRVYLWCAAWCTKPESSSCNAHIRSECDFVQSARLALLLYRNFRRISCVGIWTAWGRALALCGDTDGSAINNSFRNVGTYNYIDFTVKLDWDWSNMYNVFVYYWKTRDVVGPFLNDFFLVISLVVFCSFLFRFGRGFTSTWSGIEINSDFGCSSNWK